MPESSPITAARFSITVDGYEIASFSELQGVRTEIKTVEFIESGEKGLVQMNIPSNPVLATIVLEAGPDPGSADVDLARGRPLRRDGSGAQELLAGDVRRRRQAGRPVSPRERLAMQDRARRAACRLVGSAHRDGHDRV